MRADVNQLTARSRKRSGSSAVRYPMMNGRILGDDGRTLELRVGGNSCGLRKTRFCCKWKIYEADESWRNLAERTRQAVLTPNDTAGAVS
jgi:hypothetical protein